DVLEAELAQRRLDAGGPVVLEEARHLVTRELDARHVAVVPDAQDAEAEVAQDRFGALDGPELLVGDFGEVRDARREAGRGGFVPGRQAGLVRELADVLLGQTGLVERADDAELARGLTAGA